MAGGSMVTAVWRRVPLPAEHVVPMLMAVLLRRRSHRLPPARATVAAGLALMGAGLALVAWAVVARGDADLERPRHLTTTGPHRWTRNPMYVGWGLAHVGLGLAVRSPWALATWPFAAALVNRAVLREERRLEVAFGEEFTQYRARVGRYAGRRSPGTGGTTRASGRC
jgi:protein-S-isoprenylcysteine O-methyltransferase Ste14